ncbi:ANTAR domain-containing protein [Streptomyces sp. NPDC058657]|uniref:ANTAR domain-containing protein n=1 Tax=unclassified Streptomyces TaxID=2593676 RepID=UPI003654049D
MDRHRELDVADTFVELADTLVDSFDVRNFLRQLCLRCGQLLDVSLAAALLAPPGKEPLRIVAPCDPGGMLGELLDTAADEGPAVECHAGSARAGSEARTGTEHGTDLARVDLRVPDDRWAAFGPLARRAGYTWACALPLRLRGERLGSLLLLRTGEEPLPESDVRLAQALADAAAIGLVHARTLNAHRTTVTQLRTALDSRVLIEQAKGKLAERMRVGVDEAFAVLRRHARNGGLRLTDVAYDVVENGLVPGAATGSKGKRASVAEKR